MSVRLTAALVLLLGLIGSHWYAYHAGNRNGVNAEKVKTQATAIAALDEANERNEKLADYNATIARQENKNHAQELAAIRARAAADAARRVSIDPARFCGTTTATQATEAGSDGQVDAGTAFLSESFASDLRQLAADADEITADLRTLKARADGCFQ